eukprot:s1514_g6.t1
MTEWRRTAEHFVCGGVAGMVARTVIAPVERIKIIYQINSKSQTGWLRIIRKVVDESGGGVRSVTAFWKGNSIAVLRVFPYLGVQLASNEFFRRELRRLSTGTMDAGHDVSAPMWVVRAMDIIRMSGTPKHHQELKELGLLVRHERHHFTIFVSHQWLGGDHPDPHGLQVDVLRQALKNIIEGHVQAELDVFTQFAGKNRKISAKERVQIRDSLIWFDWFSASDMFIALVPPLLSRSSRSMVGFSSWLVRGWTEMWCKLLGSDTVDVPILIVSAADKLEFVGPYSWVQALAQNEGDFAMEGDRYLCRGVVQGALDLKLARLAHDKKQRSWFRYLAARYGDFIGAPAPSRNAEDFVSHFRFPSMEACISTRSGMGAVACAALSGDIAMVRRLVSMKASLEATKIPALWEAALPPNASPLIMTLTRTTPNSVDLLVEYGADVNLRKAPTMISPLCGMCARGAPPATVAALLKHRAEVNLNEGGLGQSALQFMSIFANGNLHSVQVAQLLLEASAEVNKPANIGPVFRIVEMASRGVKLCTKEQPLLVSWFAEMMVKLLLAARADAEFRNHRGRTPKDLAAGSRIRQILDGREDDDRDHCGVPSTPWSLARSFEAHVMVSLLAGSRVLPSMAPEVQKFIAGGGAGMTAVFCTYPLDLARARMALLIEQGAKEVPSMFGTVRDVWREAGIRGLYSGAGVSMTGAAIYCGLKFATYDASKEWCRKYLLPDPDGPPSALHRALSGGIAGVLAQTFVYPFDVLRRRLQTGGPAMKEKYPGSLRGLWTLYKEEGVVRGLYRGCALNYVKTVPNTTVYLALFDILKDAFCTA